MQYIAVAAIGIGNLGWTEVILITFVFLLLFGARRLPEIGQSLGKGIREFKKSLTSSEEEPKLGSGDQDVSSVESQKQEETTN
ncbi:MAG: twin-arginine translocase TatA/TatE family subunit [Gemmatimonadota bacterium]|nr:MAG: twin-arginine translocase TatA/TatE family subunit [Gemmatimonadota bacterium]